MREEDVEVWKNFNDSYQISSHGRVRSLDRVLKKKDGYSYHVKGKVLIQMDNGVGYAQVSLGRKYNAMAVHRLVGKLFIPNPTRKKTINHKDGNKKNNHFSNLEWSTYRENNIHARATGLNTSRGLENPPKGSAHWNSKLDEVQVKTIKVCIRDGMSNADLARYFKVRPSSISLIRTGDHWKHITV